MILKRRINPKSDRLDISILSKYIFPIYDGEDIIGQGFIADGFFITTAHLLREHPLCYAYLNENKFDLSKENPVFIGKGDICHNQAMVDVVLFPYHEIESPLQLSDGNLWN